VVVEEGDLTAGDTGSFFFSSTTFAAGAAAGFGDSGFLSKVTGVNLKFEFGLTTGSTGAVVVVVSLGFSSSTTVASFFSSASIGLIGSAISL
jgi:hypothetical protein